MFSHVFVLCLWLPCQTCDLLVPVSPQDEACDTVYMYVLVGISFLFFFFCRHHFTWERTSHFIMQRGCSDMLCNFLDVSYRYRKCPSLSFGCCVIRSALVRVCYTVLPIKIARRSPVILDIENRPQYPNPFFLRNYLIDMDTSSAISCHTSKATKYQISGKI